MENYSDTIAGKVGPFPVEQTFVVPITVRTESLCRIM
jgi:hypothetical protein